MIDNQMKKLIEQAIELVRIGKEVEHQRMKLKKLVDLHEPYDSRIMIETLELFQKSYNKWAELETHHLEYRNMLMAERHISA